MQANDGLLDMFLRTRARSPLSFANRSGFSGMRFGSLRADIRSMQGLI
jgi:hypothetical protein